MNIKDDQTGSMPAKGRLPDDKDKWNEELLQQLVGERTANLENTIQELKKSEERYHRMIDEVQEYAIILLSKDGIIQNWNKGAQKIKQYHESEAIGRHFSMFYLADDRAANLPEKLLNEALHTGRALHEGWRMRKDQTRFWGSITLTALHDSNGEVLGFSKVTRDLTEKKMAEDQLRAFAAELQQRNEALKKSEERYHKMVSEVKDYAIILLDRQGDIQNWNTGAEKIKGYTADEIVGKNFSIFYPPEDRNRNFPGLLLQEAVVNGQALHERWRVRKDGSKFWGSIVITALHGDDGSVIGFSKVTRDLTERKLAEDKMKQYLLELESQNRELEQFAYVASHDLQEPLRKIQTFTDIIEKNIHNERMTQVYFQKINASANRMSELIRSVLNYSRISRDGEQMVETDLNLILANIITDFELLIEEKGAVIVTEPLPVIKAIPLQVNQLFANLIGNALKFNANHPVIGISAKVVPGDQLQGNSSYVSRGSYLQIAFSDNGIGFEEQYEKLIFSLFQRLHGKHEYSGTGIGLALCKKIMENHHGFIRAEGAPDKGATFYVYFLLEEQPATLPETVR